MEFNKTNRTVEVGEQISIPSNDTHLVYTVSDTPSCWMYVFFNVTQWNNETIRNWILYPGKCTCFPGKGAQQHIRDLKQTTTATATRTSQNKRFNEQNNSCARAL